MQRELVARAVNESYAKSAAGTADGTLSRQTVHYCEKKSPAVQKFTVPEEPRQVRALQVFLDEDHIALQKDPAGRKHTIMPAGVVAVLGGRINGTTIDQIDHTA